MRTLSAYLVSVFLMLSFTAQLSAQQSQVTPAASGTSASLVPRLIKFSGVLLDHQGQPLKGPLGVTFSLYAQQSGDAPLWMETQNVELDEKGVYAVLLGANTASGLPEEMFRSGEARWLGVQPERETELPRVLLVSVPYALKAGDAQTLGGLPPAAFAPANFSAPANAPSPSSVSGILLAAPGGQPEAATNAGNVAALAGGGTTNFIPLWTNSTTLGNSILFQSTTSNVNVNGSLSLPALNAATSTAGANSRPLDLFSSTFSSSTHAAVSQHFRWQAEPVGNNTSSPTGKLNLLYASGTATPGETGLSINNKGIINFALGQTLPLVTGNETVSGNVSANQLISTVATGTPPLKVSSKTQVANLNASFLGGLPASAFASTGSNVFQGSQLILNSNTNSNAALSVQAEGVGPALVLRSLGGVGGGDLLGGAGTASGQFAQVFRVTNAGTGTFTGTAPSITSPFILATIGDVGCGVGDSGAGSAGIQLTKGSVGLNCTGYSLLGDGVNTFINAPVSPAGSPQGIKFRLGNQDKMILVSGCTSLTTSDSPCFGIGTTTPDEMLTVNGHADKPGGGSWDTFSDGRLKNVSDSFHSGLKEVLQLNPIRYQYKEENPLGIHDSAEHIGLVAQEVEKVIPEAVSANNKGYLLVNNDPILWTMLNAIKEQQRQIRAQQKQLRIQAAELAKLKARLEGPATQPAPR